MPNILRNKSHNEGSSSINKDVLVAAGLGLFAGAASKSIAIEVFAHQELSHHTLKTKPWVNKFSRVVLAAYGLSANKFALRHRKHHRADHMEAQKSTVGAISATLKSSGTNEAPIDPSKPEVQHWSQSELFDDPLTKVEDGKRIFNDNPWYERFAAKGGLTAAIPPAIGFMAVFTAAKFAGSKRPAVTATCFVASSLVPMGLQPGITSYTENKSGISDGRINTSRLSQPLRCMVERHDQHHEKPDRHDLGITPVDKLVIGVGKATGQIEVIN